MRSFVRDWAISSKVSSATFILRKGSEALSVFREREFDGIFTDVGMPGMSGWELAREIRQINKEIPIAVITGWGEAGGSNECRRRRLDNCETIYGRSNCRARLRGQ